MKIEQLPNLKKLKLSNTSLCEENLEDFFKKCPQIEEIELSGQREIISAIRHLLPASLTKLQKVNFTGTGIPIGLIEQFLLAAPNTKQVIICDCHISSFALELVKRRKEHVEFVVSDQNKCD